MRALAIVVLALIAAAASASAAPVNVAAILKNPTAYIDKHLSVSGIMGHGNNGYWAICPSPEDRKGLGPATAEHPICIELRARDDNDLDAHEEKYRGAIATITGPYWHRCLPAIREREPEVAREECKDAGINGYIGVEAISIHGYVDLTTINGEFGESQYAPNPVAEISPQDVASAGIDAFVQKFLDAVRAKDTNALSLLYPKELRGFARVGLGTPTARLHWLVLSPEMAVTNEGARHRGSGYRAYGGDRSAEVCFCRRKDCTNLWPRTTDDIYASNIAGPTVCQSIIRAHGAWWLRE